MSVVAVHGPYTFGSRGIYETEELIGTVNPTNGLIWDFRLDYPTTRSAQDFSWAFPTDGTPTPQTVIDPTAVTYATPGSKTVTLTVTNTARTVSNKALTSNVATLTTTAPHGFVAGQYVTVAGVDATFNGTYVIATVPTGSTLTYAKTAADVTSAASGGSVTSASTQYPAAGTHTITITAVTGEGPPGTSLRSLPPEEGGEGYDPGEHTVSEVQTYVTENPDEAGAVYDAEVDGKARSTLLTWLEEQIPFDPEAYTVQEVVDYAEANPDQLEDIIAAEQAGKNRTTLVSQLESMRS
jgi:hypothetical protein